VFGDSLSSIIFSIRELLKFLKLQEDTYLLELHFSPSFGTSFSRAFFFSFFLSVLAARQQLDVHIKPMWLTLAANNQGWLKKINSKKK